MIGCEIELGAYIKNVGLNESQYFAKNRKYVLEIKDTNVLHTKVEF